MSGSGAGLERASRAHRATIDAFLHTAAAVPAERWSTPLAPGKWSPAQVALHVLRSYQVLLDQLHGGAPMKMLAGPWKSRFLRWFILPHILFHRTLPTGVEAPVEVKPDDEGVDQAELPSRLTGAVERADQALRTTRRDHFVHAYFGAIPLRKVLPFAAIHTEHHRRQLAAVAAGSG